MGKSANLPAPFKGVNESVPVAALQSPYCQNLLNFNTTNAGISLRNGDSNYAAISTANILNEVKTFGKYGESNLFIKVYDTVSTENKVYDVDSGSLVYTTAALGNADFQPQYFNKYLYFFTSDPDYDPGFYYDGSAWGVITYTGSGFSPRGGGNSYKNRNYIIQDGEAAYWYSGIDAISGALTKVDLSGVVNERCTLSNIAELTLSDQVGTTSIQSFCFSNGDIYFYEGSYPDSPTWRQIGHAKIGQLVSTYNSVFAYQGDAIILSDNGISSLRDLFLKGSNNAFNFSVNKNVQETWKDIIQAARQDADDFDGPISSRIRGIWDYVNSRIIINIPYDYNLDTKTFSATGNFFFVYNTINESWYYHQSSDGQDEFGDIEFFKNKILLSNVTSTSSSIYINEKEGATGFTDRNSDNSANSTYSFTMLTAPIPFPKTAVYEATAIEPILESDLYAQTNWNLIADFGRQTSGNQTTDALTTSVAKPLANVGMQNITYVQVKMSGTTAASKTVGLDLYSYNVWYDSGQEGSR